MPNKSTKVIIDSLSTAEGEDAKIVSEILAMNGGSDVDIIIENLQNYITFRVNSSHGSIANTAWYEFIIDVQWDVVYQRIKSWKWD